MSRKNKKLVVIGDIVSSRKITNRTLVQRKLSRALEQINKREPKPASPYTITLGDEFQAVLNSADSLFYDAMSILLAVYPEKVRFSFGIGIIETPINRKLAIGMDGPAFYNAREGIEEAKENRVLFNVSGMSSLHTGLIRQSLYLISHLFRNWKRRRFEVLVMLYKELSVKEISTRLQISDKAVYKAIDAGALKTTVQLLEEIKKDINTNLEER